MSQTITGAMDDAGVAGSVRGGDARRAAVRGVARRVTVVAMSAVVVMATGVARAGGDEGWSSLLVGWGSNQYGQLNTPAGLANVTQIAAGYYHTIALKSDGTVACWGSNNYGQCSNTSRTRERHTDRGGRLPHHRVL